jgi:hypothetical protein
MAASKAVAPMATEKERRLRGGASRSAPAAFRTCQEIGTRSNPPIRLMKFVKAWRGS